MAPPHNCVPAIAPVFLNEARTVVEELLLLSNFKAAPLYDGLGEVHAADGLDLRHSVLSSAPPHVRGNTDVSEPGCSHRRRRGTQRHSPGACI